jgi:hypothetical protein
MATTSVDNSLATFVHVGTVLLDLSYVELLPLLLNSRDQLLLRFRIPLLYT